MFTWVSSDWSWEASLLFSRWFPGTRQWLCDPVRGLGFMWCFPGSLVCFTSSGSSHVLNRARGSSLGVTVKTIIISSWEFGWFPKSGGKDFFTAFSLSDSDEVANQIIGPAPEPDLHLQKRLLWVDPRWISSNEAAPTENWAGLTLRLGER